MSMFTIASLDIGERFTLKEDNTNGCIYRKIKPIDIQGVLCNAVRCWIHRSELVRYPKRTSVMKIVE
jgi:hypothetical protein